MADPANAQAAVACFDEPDEFGRLQPVWMQGRWSERPLFALDADVTVYWPDVRPCWEDEKAGKGVLGR